MARHESGLFWRKGAAGEAAVLVDAENYFRAFHRSAAQARHYILIAGWQFELETRLLRGADAQQSGLPVTFWSFLRALCDRREELQVFVLAWDYSLVYILEREWLQSARAKLRSHPRMQLAFRTHPDGLGSHHQKLVVIDDQVAFLGGIDFCESRWDTRRHQVHDEQRRNSAGLPSKPYHDIQAVVSGPVVADLTELFQDAWTVALQQPLDLPPLPKRTRPREELGALLGTEILPLPAQGMVLCRTLPRRGSSPEVREIQKTYEHLIRSAQRLIYIETQYFTSSAIGNALRERMADMARPKLAVVIVMPSEADSPKEHFVLGGREDHILSSLRVAAARHGHALRIVSVAERDASGRRASTFIHSKLMLVDDAAVTFGSANLTNRSMSFDSELNLAWNVDVPGEPVPEIRELRASLLGEHAGRDPALFRDASRLLERLDAELRDPTSKLEQRHVSDAPEDDSLWTAVFDPSTELWTRHQSDLRAYAREARNDGLLQRLFWTARLAVRLAEVFRATRLSKPNKAQSTVPQPRTDLSPSPASARRISLKFVGGLIVLYAAVAALGNAFAAPLQQMGRAFVDALGLPGFALGTFLADGLHFPVPPQFYMLMIVALHEPAVWALLSITAGSILGGVFGFVVSQRLSRARWIQRRLSRLSAPAVTRYVREHPYRWVTLASLTPIAFSWICYLAGLYRFPRRAMILLCVLRVPKVALYYAIIRAGWTHVFP